MTADEGLFDMAAAPIPEPAPKLSADRARTIRQAMLIAKGGHPLAYLGALRHPQTRGLTYRRDDPRGREFTCGTCRLRVIQGEHSAKGYPKCMAGGRDTGGASSDVRAFWPACRQYEVAP